MSRKVVIGCLLSSCVMISTNASANNHTVSLGYAQSKVQHFKIFVELMLSTATSGILQSVL